MIIRRTRTTSFPGGYDEETSSSGDSAFPGSARSASLVNDRQPAHSRRSGNGIFTLRPIIRNAKARHHAGDHALQPIAHGTYRKRRARRLAHGTAYRRGRRLMEDRLARLKRTENDFLERIADRELRVRQGSSGGAHSTATDPIRKRLLFLLADVRKSRQVVERQLAREDAITLESRNARRNDAVSSRDRVAS